MSAGHTTQKSAVYVAANPASHTQSHESAACVECCGHSSIPSPNRRRSPPSPAPTRPPRTPPARVRSPDSAGPAAMTAAGSHSAPSHWVRTCALSRTAPPGCAGTDRSSTPICAARSHLQSSFPAHALACSRSPPSHNNAPPPPLAARLAQNTLASTSSV
eukprot:1459334-Rhodomonas_salina.1